jgi:hypothetical protein
MIIFYIFQGWRNEEPKYLITGSEQFEFNLEGDQNIKTAVYLECDF